MQSNTLLVRRSRRVIPHLFAWLLSCRFCGCVAQFNVDSDVRRKLSSAHVHSLSDTVDDGICSFYPPVFKFVRQQRSTQGH
ncbi:uncharacterized protein B0H18DRAFT_974492 [Fomitopsis serialis]|uniref:uncharacterized protein n=1 Tax=Fomitopsis serialis TaxID=139415 RepID=UPI0020082163|nr:uncharacterized protein B0H18DRAFT_974492 [Neoantrodia serialis]KAH9936575.1 hypothetical protein B0H18DRAFT_974492 [Neoantrodia serialis]